MLISLEKKSESAYNFLAFVVTNEFSFKIHPKHEEKFSQEMFKAFAKLLVRKFS